MSNKLQIVLLIIILVLGGLYYYTERTGSSITEFFESGSKTVRINNIPFSVIIADTPEERKTGLSGRDQLGAQGMLFVFEESDYHGIWMKDMRFPIDVIWIGEDRTVLSVTENLSPESFPQVFEPSRPVRYLIETNTHFAETFGFGPGDQVVLPRGVE
jgi:uncharacterized protein